MPHNGTIDKFQHVDKKFRVSQSDDELFLGVGILFLKQKVTPQTPLKSDFLAEVVCRIQGYG